MMKNEDKVIIPYFNLHANFTLGDKHIITTWGTRCNNKLKKFQVEVILGNNREEVRIGNIVKSDLSLEETKELVEANEELIIKHALYGILDVCILEKLDEFCQELEIPLVKQNCPSLVYIFSEDEEVKKVLAIDKAFFTDHFVKAEIHLHGKYDKTKRTLLVYVASSFFFRNNAIFYPHTIYQTQEGDYVVESVKRLE